jgi:alpha-1,3-glucan synthase
MLWSTSNIGSYVPWAGSPVASTLVGRGLWLWLGVLDALQGVGKFTASFFPSLH